MSKQSNSEGRELTQEEIDELAKYGRQKTLGESNVASALVDEDDTQEGDEDNDEDLDQENDENDTEEDDDLDADEEEEEQKPQKPATGVEKRIARITQKRREAERKAEELAEKLRAYEAGEKPEQENKQPTRAELLAQVKREEEIRDFGNRCTRISQRIAAKYGQEEVKDLYESMEDSGFDAENEDHLELMRDLTKHPKSAALYRALAKDYDAAQAIFTAPTRKQYAMLERYIEKFDARSKNRVSGAVSNTEQSGASKPVRRVSGTASANKTGGNTGTGSGDLTSAELLSIYPNGL